MFGREFIYHFLIEGIPIIAVIIAFVIGFIINEFKNYLKLKIHLRKFLDVESQMQINELETNIKEKDKKIRALKRDLDKRNNQLSKIRGGNYIINEALE